MTGRHNFDSTNHTYIGPLAPPAERDWRAKANCAGLKIDETERIFYPKNGLVTDEARLLCSGCSVRQECDNFASAMREHHGTWAGVSRERV